MAKTTAVLSGPKRNIRKLRQLIGGSLPEFILLLVCIFLAFANYTPNTWLIGWDNLLPEFDFKQNLIRNLFGVWSEYRGPGLLAGQAHLADLPRIIILFGLHSLGLASNLLRYLWTFAMLYLGAIGIVWLFRYLLKSKFDRTTIQLAAFLSGMFYIFNLSTLQLFFVPFDSFATFYGFLPWFVLSFLTALYTKRGLKSFLFLGITSLLISPSFFVYTLTIPLALYLTPFILERIASGGKRFDKIKAIFFPTIITLTTQAYWLLPIAFFILSGNAKIVSLARINTVSSPETLQRNLQFSGLNYVLQLRGYLFENLDLLGEKYAPLLGVWRDHLSQPTIVGIQILIILITIFGFVFSFRRKLKHERSLAAATLVTIFFMIGASLPVLNQIPLLGEALRAPFTKFSYSLALSYSIYFGIGSLLIMDLFSFLHHRFTYFLTAFSLGVAMIIFMTPAFTGNLIAPSMRLTIPPEYGKLFEFFNSVDPATRIANFPQYTFWGWNYYSWGYRGSGFLWYDIKQPILDRAFDVWEHNSEKYYEEMSTALYSESQVDFENLIDKYAVNWILIDRNVISPSPNIDLGLTKLQKFLDSSPKFTLAKNIDDKILIYKTDVDQKVKNFLSLSNEQLSMSNEQLFDLPLRPSPSVVKDGQIILNYEQRALSNGQLLIPSYTETESLVPHAVSYRKTSSGFQLKFEPILPRIKVNDKTISQTTTPVILDFILGEGASGLILDINSQYLEVQLPDELLIQNTFYPLSNVYLPSHKATRISVYANTPIQKLDLTTPLSLATPKQCYTNKPNRKIEKIVEGKIISLFGTDLVGCLSAPIPPAGINQLISLEFSYKSSTGTPANANITNRALGGESSPQALSAKSESTFTRVFAKPLLEPLQANLILEANETKSTQEIIYQNISVSYLPLLGESSFNLPPIPSQLVAMSTGRSTMGNISVSIPIIDGPLTHVTTKGNNLLNPSPRNCDNFNTGKFDRIVTDDGFRFTSENADSCDQISLKNLPHEINYAVLADIKNEKGLLPTVCLENYSTRRCDIYERLISGPQMILEPISNPNELAGYTLHLSNQSFGARGTSNLVRSMTITPFPLQFLKNITISSNSQIPKFTNSQLLDSNHPAEFLYTSTINNGNNQILNLYQTRSPYWKALEVSKSDQKLPLWSLVAKLPFLYFSNQKNELRAVGNGQWFNSWSLPACPPKCEAFGVVIFYLPQYLEFLGLLLLPLPLIGVLIHALVRKFKPKP